MSPDDRADYNLNHLLPVDTNYAPDSRILRIRPKAELSASDNRKTLLAD